MNQPGKLRLSRKRFDPLQWIPFLAWKHRWEIFAVLVVVAMPGAAILLFNVVGMPGAAILLRSFARSGFLGWTLFIPVGTLILLVVAGLKREGRRFSRPVPPQPPGAVYDVPSPGAQMRPQQAERHAA